MDTTSNTDIQEIQQDLHNLNHMLQRFDEDIEKQLETPEEDSLLSTLEHLS